MDKKLNDSLKGLGINSKPLGNTKRLAKQYGCDLGIPNGEGTGVGNIIMYTRLVEEYARKLGRPVNLLTAPLRPKVGVMKNEIDYPIWFNNPYVKEIVNANDHESAIIDIINDELEDFAQFNHIIENLCFSYDVRPRELRPSLFLTKDECKWALKTLSNLKRPLICIHPGGTTSSRADSSWFIKNWEKVIVKHRDKVGFVKIGKKDIDKCVLDVFSPETTLREVMAIIWASDIFIGFDSSPMHIATSFQKPVLCLLDMTMKFEAESQHIKEYVPSVILRWAYPQNRNIAIIGEKDNEVLKMVNRFITENVNLIQC